MQRILLLAIVEPIHNDLQTLSLGQQNAFSVNIQLLGSIDRSYGVATASFDIKLKLKCQSKNLHTFKSILRDHNLLLSFSGPGKVPNIRVVTVSSSLITVQWDEMEGIDGYPLDFIESKDVFVPTGNETEGRCRICQKYVIIFEIKIYKKQIYIYKNL